MNENLNLVEILKDCPKGTKLYSTVFGEVEYVGINESSYRRINFTTSKEIANGVTSDGRHFDHYDGECTLFPSKEQRDWSKFTAPWCNLEKQDEQKKQVRFPKFTLDDVLALQYCMETVKKVQEDKELYEQLNLIHSKIYDAYWIEKQGKQASSYIKEINDVGYKCDAKKKELNKKDKFDPKTLKPFDKVLLFNSIGSEWKFDFYSHKNAKHGLLECVGYHSSRVIPYNEETKHLIGTTDDAPEFYRYWED